MGLSGLIRTPLIHDRNLLELVWLMLADWVFLALFAALMGLALWRGAHFLGLRRRRDDLISISVYYPWDIGSVTTCLWLSSYVVRIHLLILFV